MQLQCPHHGIECEKDIARLSSKQKETQTERRVADENYYDGERMDDARRNGPCGAMPKDR
jgi:hypothetical protein